LNCPETRPVYLLLKDIREMVQDMNIITFQREGLRCGGRPPSQLICSFALSGIIYFLILFFNTGVLSAADVWKKLDNGLFLGSFDGQSLEEEEPLLKSYPLTVLKVDPAYFSFKLLCTSELDGKPRTVRNWARDFDLRAAINASMYQKDRSLISTGYMKNFQHINNSGINKSFGLFMVFNPMTDTQAPVNFLDRHLTKGWQEQLEQYFTGIQNYRMISNGLKRGWSEGGRRYATAAIGMDRKGNVLLIYCQAPFTTSDFINILLELPLEITEAMYLEGGSEAALFVKSGQENDESEDFYPKVSIGRSRVVPNVIGIVKKK
jgi:uncharacterized protein YigE (DUF2233 family)